MTFEFDLALFSLTAIKKAAYRFLAHYSIEITQPDPSIAIVTLTPKSGLPFSGPDCSNLPNEVLDQDLREIVATETKPFAELLLAQAFSGLALIDPVGDNADEHDDPLLIRSASGPHLHTNDGARIHGQ